MKPIIGTIAAASLMLLAACGGENPAEPDETAMPIFESTNDVGDVKTPGATQYDAEAKTFTLAASGANIWGTEDAFHYTWTKMSGDLTFSAKIGFVGDGGDPHRKAGLMIRESLDADAPYVDVMLHGDGLTSLQYREEKGGETRQLVANVSGPAGIKIEKIGDVFYMSVIDEDGNVAPASGALRMAFTEPYYVGLALSAHDNDATESAVFSDVSLDMLHLAPIEDTGYGATVDAALEILTIADGNRRLVKYFDDKMEAPNWSRDGAYLIYNRNGGLYKIPVEGGRPERINTGPLERLNNDHGVSPDGTQLIVSDQTNEDHHSRIYVLPIEGADDPRLVIGSDTGYSYWHAWSPISDMLVYTANRPEVSDDWNLYAIKLSGGDEWPLTTTEGLDDGADFSPDGAWVYFNSTRTGNMKIWRIHPDGTGAEQVTFDADYRDWFAHPSPDGKWIVMVSFGLDVDLSDHPPNRSVVLRIMPADGGEPPRVLTKLFGGQGTMNVPSWSPDSKEIAFVSYRLDRE